MPKAAASAPKERKPALVQMQETVPILKGKIDLNFPAAMNPLDLLWHEMGKLTVKQPAG